MGPSNCDKMKMAFKKGTAACLQMASTVGQIKQRRADAAPMPCQAAPPCWSVSAASVLGNVQGLQGFSHGPPPCTPTLIIALLSLCVQGANYWPLHAPPANPQPLSAS